MTTETRAQIRKLMTESGAWEMAENGRIYTTEEFLAAYGDRIPAELASLLTKHVSRLQYYFDERILEPINKQ